MLFTYQMFCFSFIVITLIICIYTNAKQRI